MSYTFTYQYKYNINCSNAGVLDGFFCTIPSGVCFTHGSVKNPDTVFSNSILSSVGSCSDITLVSSNFTTITCDPLTTNQYYNCSFTSGGGGSMGGNGGGSNNGGYFHGNVISSSDGAKLTFSETALAEGIGTPIFTWGSNLINLVIKFFPILLLIAFFGICLSALGNLGKIRKDKTNKDLSNK